MRNFLIINFLYNNYKMSEKIKCLHCKKSIVAFGNARKNGCDRKDWDTRRYHVKCWKELKDYAYMRQLYQRNNGVELNP